MLPISGGWKPKVRVPTCSGPGDGRRPLLAVFTWQEGRGQRARVPSEKGANAFGGLHLHDRISITSGARASTREFGGTHPPAHSILRLTSVSIRSIAAPPGQELLLDSTSPFACAVPSPTSDHVPPPALPEGTIWGKA